MQATATRQRRMGVLTRACFGLLLVALNAVALPACRPVTSEDPPTPAPTPTPEPIVPTATGEAADRTEPDRGDPTATGETADRIEPERGDSTVTASPPVDPAEGRERFGVCSGAAVPVPGSIGIGWYLTWGVRAGAAPAARPDHWQMVRVSEKGYRPDPDSLRQAARDRPGAVWLIGNEPDVPWQDNTTPERYAEIYRELYLLLKSVDPECQVAIGGVSQPTPLRLEYLDRVLAAYRQKYGYEMPIDLWNVHNFILREERGSWGVDIPPGFDTDVGTLREIDDHDDMEIFRNQIIAFRAWMAARGQRDRPLVISEYGILMPSDYGFGYERLKAFMYGTFDYFLTAKSDLTGYPADDNRLVQYWAWFSLASVAYPTGDLYDVDSGELTPLGVAFTLYEPASTDEGD